MFNFLFILSLTLHVWLNERQEFDRFESDEYASSAQKNQLELYVAEPRSDRTSSI